MGERQVARAGGAPQGREGCATPVRGGRGPSGVSAPAAHQSSLPSAGESAEGQSA